MKSRRSPEEPSDIRGFHLPPVPHVAALMRATISVSMRVFFRPVLAFAIMLPPAVSLAQTPAPVDLRILAINDFHGYLRPPPGGITIADPADPSKKITVPAGGAEHMATLVRE